MRRAEQDATDTSRRATTSLSGADEIRHANNWAAAPPARHQSGVYYFTEPERMKFAPAKRAKPAQRCFAGASALCAPRRSPAPAGDTRPSPADKTKARSIARAGRVLQGAREGVYDCTRPSKQRNKARPAPQDSRLTLWQVIILSMLSKQAESR